MDIGVNNPDCFYETPNIDALAKTGLLFTDGYATCPVCSPSRVSMLTGKYPTTAEALKTKGYATYFAGKWHLGYGPNFRPQKQGFDINIGGHDRGGPYTGKKYFAPFKNPEMKDDGPVRLLSLLKITRISHFLHTFHSILCIHH